MRIHLNGEMRELAADISSLENVIRELGLSGKRIAVERNGEIVPRSRHVDTAIEDGDRIEIVVAVGGG